MPCYAIKKSLHRKVDCVGLPFKIQIMRNDFRQSVSVFSTWLCLGISFLFALFLKFNSQIIAQKNNAIYTSNGALVYDGLNDVIQSSSFRKDIYISGAAKIYGNFNKENNQEDLIREHKKNEHDVEVKISTSRKIVHHVLHNNANSKNLEKALLKAKIEIDQDKGQNPSYQNFNTKTFGIVSLQYYFKLIKPREDKSFCLNNFNYTQANLFQTIFSFQELVCISLQTRPPPFLFLKKI